jgi:YjbE family integral membrane protein
VAGIILVDLVLAGDNAVVIAMAVRNLPGDQRRRGILLGAGAAVVLRVIATFFVARFLLVGFVRLLGGCAVLWIGIRLFAQNMPYQGSGKRATTVWQAIQLIVVADITLSIDNMLAVGGLSQGNLPLLLFGLAVSIPFVVFASDLLSSLMDRHPIIVAVGAAMLGKVGAEMIITDPVLERVLHLSRPVEYATQAAGALFVLAIGRLVVHRSAPASRDAHRPDGGLVRPRDSRGRHVNRGR